MVISKRLIIVVTAVVLAVAVGLAWPRGSKAAPSQPVAPAHPSLAVIGDPVLADISLNGPGLQARGKYVFFILERENSSHRWFMRFNSETGELCRLTPDQGWVVVDSTGKMR